MNIPRSLLLLPFLGILSAYCVTALYNLHSEDRKQYISHFVSLPEPLARAMTLEFPGLASDILMLKTLSFLGEKVMNNEQPSHEEWQNVYQILTQITNLDPRFMDPYVVAQTTLPFEAKMVRETNILLEKAAEILTEDYRPHFFLWHNYFYFLNDPKTAGEHLEKAARMPGAPVYFTTLAARMNLYAGKINVAVIYLEETLRETSEPSMQKFLTLRIEALKKIGFLENAVMEFKKRYNIFPKHLQELIECGLVLRIPKDPYGGEFFIMEKGRVYSTSKLVLPNTKNK
jgi:hypothetical protein